MNVPEWVQREVPAGDVVRFAQKPSMMAAAWPASQAAILLVIALMPAAPWIEPDPPESIDECLAREDEEDANTTTARASCAFTQTARALDPTAFLGDFAWGASATAMLAAFSPLRALIAAVLEARFTYVVITDARVMVVSSRMKQERHAIPLESVSVMSAHQAWWERVLGLWSLEVDSRASHGLEGAGARGTSTIAVAGLRQVGEWMPTLMSAREARVVSLGMRNTGSESIE